MPRLSQRRLAHSFRKIAGKRARALLGFLHRKKERFALLSRSPAHDTARHTFKFVRQDGPQNAVGGYAIRLLMRSLRRISAMWRISVRPQNKHLVVSRRFQ